MPCSVGSDGQPRTRGGLDALPAQLARAGFVETTELDPVTTRLGRVRLFRAQPR
jgi:hypothetical protein